MLALKNAPADSVPADFAELGAPVIALMRDIAARELMPRFRRVAAERKKDGSLVTEADRAVEQALAAALPALVNCPVLGEEMPEEAQKKIWREADWCWCVDPLDGTGNFTNGKRYFGVSVALMHQRKSVFGAVFDPNAGEAFHAVRQSGAYLNGRRLKPMPASSLAEARVEVGRYKRLGRLALALRSAPFKSFSQSGASVLQWCHMACGRTDAFVHAGEQPWDYAAGALILEEAGGRLATLAHDDYWRIADLDSSWERSVIAARHPALFDEWKRWVRSHL
jgi:fructose-1,6-bisphosphatase/inositol monophosphatase family enzyme